MRPDVSRCDPDFTQRPHLPPRRRLAHDRFMGCCATADKGDSGVRTAPAGGHGVHNDEVATAFEEIADLLDLQGANPFRIRAYRRAALMLRGLPRDVATIHAEGGDLRELPGIGEDLAAQIEELLRTGRDHMLLELRRQFPRGATELLRLPGLGPKRVRTLIDSLHVGNVAALRRALQQGQLDRLPRFGPALITKLKAAVAPAARAPARRGLRNRWRLRCEKSRVSRPARSPAAIAVAETPWATWTSWSARTLPNRFAVRWNGTRTSAA